MGRPLRIVDLGETGIDEQTWEDYINEMRHVYTADKYHLLGQPNNMRISVTYQA